MLSIVELGGYPSFAPLKRPCPVLIVSEFNGDPMFGDRPGKLESPLASIQRLKCAAPVSVFSEKERRAHLEEVLAGYAVFRVSESRVDAVAWDAAVREAAQI